MPSSDFMYAAILKTSYFSYQLFSFCAKIQLPSEVPSNAFQEIRSGFSLGEIIIIDSSFQADFAFSWCACNPYCSIIGGPLISAGVSHKRRALTPALLPSCPSGCSSLRGLKTVNNHLIDHFCWWVADKKEDLGVL